MTLLAISKSVCNYVTKSLLLWAAFYLLRSLRGARASCPALCTNYWSVLQPTKDLRWWPGPQLSVGHLGWILQGSASQRMTFYFFSSTDVKIHYMSCIRWGEAVTSLANLVFSLLWLWRRETPETRPRREAPAAAETLRWWRPTAPIHNHLAATERLNKWDEWLTELQLFAHKLYETCH